MTFVKKQRWPFFFPVVLLLGIICLYAYVQFIKITDNSASDNMVKSEDFRMKIGGFQYTGYKGDKKVITVNADTFTVKKKKIGFFRTSLLNSAFIKNAVINIYSSTQGDTKNIVSSDTLSGISFKDVFSQNTLPANSIKNISSLFISPVNIKLFAGDSLLTSVNADSAKIRIKQKDILFEGNVTIKSKEKELKAGKAVFIPEKAVFRIISSENNGDQKPDGVNAQVTDIYLNKIKVQFYKNQRE